MKNLNDEIERLELISSFLKGAMSKKQLLQFKKRLETDRILAEEFSQHRQLLELLHQQQINEVIDFNNPENDPTFTSDERVYRRKQLRAELDKIKNQKAQQELDWQRKTVKHQQVAVFKMATVFFMAIGVGAGLLLGLTYLIEQQPQARQTQSVPLLVEVETTHTQNNLQESTPTLKESIEKNQSKETIAQTSTNPSKNTISNVELPEEDRLAFVPVEEMEQQLLKNVRSSICLVSPASTSTYGQSLVFEWNGETEEAIYLELVNTKGEKKRFDGLSSPFTLDAKLEKDLYYWVLQTESEVLARGKFIKN